MEDPNKKNLMIDVSIKEPVIYKKGKKIFFNEPVLEPEISKFSFPKYEKFSSYFN